jgi:hypothetical protein
MQPACHGLSSLAGLLGEMLAVRRIGLELRADPTAEGWRTCPAQSKSNRPVQPVGTFLGQSLKSSQGREDWLRFFELIGSGFALVEGWSTAANVPDDPEILLNEIRDAERRLRAKKTLEAFGQALVFHETDKDVLRSDASYYLFVLEPEKRTLTAWPYDAGALEQATENYLTQEKNLATTSGDTVLVASDSLESLRRAFPNYFLDTRTFVEEMDRLLA